MQPNDQNPVNQTDNSTPDVDNNTPSTAPEMPNVSSDSNTASPEASSTTEPQVITPTAPTTDTAAEPPASTEPVETPAQEPGVEASAAPETPEASETSAVPSGDAPASGAAAGAVVAGAAAVAAANSQNNEAPKKGKNKLKLLIVAVVVVLLVAAGSAGAYFGIFLPNHPQKIVGDALFNTVSPEKFKSSKFEGEVSFTGGEVSKMLSSVTFEGGTDAANEAVDLKVTANTAVTKVNLDLRSTDGKSLYLRLSGLSGLDRLLAAGTSSPEEAAVANQFLPMLTQLNDQWFVIDESLFNQVPGASSVIADEKLSNEDADRIGEIYKKHQFITVGNRLDDQDIHGVASYHFPATINKDQLKAFLEEVKSANIKALPIEQETIDSLNEVDFSKYPFEIWVSKKDRYITQLSTNFEDQGTKTTVRIAFKDINQEVKVEKPENAKSVLELLGGLSQLQGGGEATDTPVLMGL